MDYRDKIKKAIECPQFGNSRYGEWGALRYEQRVLIKRLLDELDSADECILRLDGENQKLKEDISFCLKSIEQEMKMSTDERTKQEMLSCYQILSEWSDE